MPKKAKAKKIWYAIERIPDINYIMLYHVFVDYGKRLKKQGAGDYVKHMLWVIKDGVGDLCYVRSELDKTVKHIASKAIANPEWLEKMNKMTELCADEYLAYSRSLLKLDLTKLSDKQLVDKIERLLDAQVNSHGYGQATTWLIDADHQLFSNYLLEHLRKVNRQKKLKLNLTSAFSIITTPLKPSFVEMENRESLKLAQEIAKDKVAVQIFKECKLDRIETELKIKRPKLLAKLKKHQQKWFWLHYNYRGPVLELDYFLQIWQGLIKEGKVNKYVQEAKVKFGQLKKEQQVIFKQLKLDAHHKKLFQEARYIVWLKGYRKDCMYFGAYVINQLIKELARRLYISFHQAEYMYREEFGQALLKKKFNAQELAQRAKFSIIYATWDNMYVYTGQQAKDFLQKLKWEKREIKKIDKLTGQTACPGKARGIVKIVETVADISKMKQGDIMLSETTYPALVPAMKKAAAIVTNLGGLTCHAAIVARELKIPCVVGTKIATKVLRDGDKVEVDANKGIVRKI